MSGPAKAASASLDRLTQAGRSTQGLRATRRELTGLARDLQVLQQRSQAVGNFQGMLRGLADVRQRFNQAQQEVRETSRALREARQRLSDLQQVKPFGRGIIARELRENLHQAERDVRNLSSEYQRAQRDVRNASSAFDAQKTALIQLRGEMRNMGQPVTNLSRQQRDLEEQIRRTSRALDQQNRTRVPAGAGQPRAPAGGGAARGGIRPGIAVDSDLAVAAGSTYMLQRGFMTIHDFQDELNRAQQKGDLTVEDRARVEAVSARSASGASHAVYPRRVAGPRRCWRTYLRGWPERRIRRSAHGRLRRSSFALAGDISPLKQVAAAGRGSASQKAVTVMPQDTIEG